MPQPTGKPQRPPTRVSSRRSSASPCRSAGPGERPRREQRSSFSSPTPRAHDSREDIDRARGLADDAPISEPRTAAANSGSQPTDREQPDSGPRKRPLQPAALQSDHLVREPQPAGRSAVSCRYVARGGTRAGDDRTRASESGSNHRESSGSSGGPRSRRRRRGSQSPRQRAAPGGESVPCDPLRWLDDPRRVARRRGALCRGARCVSTGLCFGRRFRRRLAAARPRGPAAGEIRGGGHDADPASRPRPRGLGDAAAARPGAGGKRPAGGGTPDTRRSTHSQPERRRAHVRAGVWVSASRQGRPGQLIVCRVDEGAAWTGDRRPHRTYLSGLRLLRSRPCLARTRVEAGSSSAPCALLSRDDCSHGWRPPVGGRHQRVPVGVAAGAARPGDESAPGYGARRGGTSGRGTFSLSNCRHIEIGACRGFLLPWALPARAGSSR